MGNQGSQGKIATLVYDFYSPTLHHTYTGLFPFPISFSFFFIFLSSFNYILYHRKSPFLSFSFYNNTLVIIIIIIIIIKRSEIRGKIKFSLDVLLQDYVTIIKLYVNYIPSQKFLSNFNKISFKHSSR